MTNKNYPAFPTGCGEHVMGERGECGCAEGLTKREYFAAMAMQGFLSAKLNDEKGNFSIEVFTAKAAVVMADALIAELNK